MLRRGMRRDGKKAMEDSCGREGYGGKRGRKEGVTGEVCGFKRWNKHKKEYKKEGNEVVRKSEVEFLQVREGGRM